MTDTSKTTFGLRNEKILKAKLIRDNTWPESPGKTCADCRFFGRDKSLSGFTGLMHPCRKSGVRLTDDPAMQHMASYNGTVLYEYQNRNACRYFEEDNG